ILRRRRACPVPHALATAGIASRARVSQIADMLVIDDLLIKIGERRLLDGASAQIPNGARVGLVGRNGSGKTTLFRAIAKELIPARGDVHLPARWRIGRLSQEAPDGPESLVEMVLRADQERIRL